MDRFCYYKKGEDDDELSEGLRSPDALYAHKAALGREHPFNPVAVAFLSKPTVNGTGCGNHFGPSYGYITSNAPGCYHEFDYGYDGYAMCNGAAPHSLNGNQMRGHLQATNSLGKPPNEEEEDAYLEQNPEERENYEKKDDDHSEPPNKYGCVQCGQIRTSLTAASNLPGANHPAGDCCGCDCTNLTNLTTTDGKSSIDTTLTRAILEQYGGESVAGDSLNSTVGLRDMIDCVTPATTTTCGRTSSGNTTNNEEDDDEHNKSSANESSNLENDNDFKEEHHLSSLLTQATNNLHTSLVKPVDLGSEEDSNEDTSDEHIAILNRKPRKELIKKWRSSTSTETNASSSCSNNGASPSNNKSNVPLLIESQAEQFEID